eukprot:s2259_g2.t1
MKECFAGKMGTKPSKAQQSTQDHVCQRVVRFLARLDDVYGEHLPWFGSVAASGANTKAAEDIRADAVDLPATAGTCDPAMVINPELTALIQDPTHIFPHGALATSTEVLRRDKRAEYVKLTLRELRCGKLRLRRKVEAVGAVFAACKSGGRQRKIWDGSRLSMVASRPPKPYRLANPSSFLDLELADTDQLLFSKRDASTYFDTLQAPAPLRQWFGQPPVSVGELLSAGCSYEDVTAMCDDFGPFANGDEFFPVHTVWPMGFSWSSAVAQDNTVAICKAAGISEDNILSLDHDIPSDQRELCLVATDDTVLIHKDPHLGASTLHRLDEAFALHKVPRNTAKDVTLATELTALGCDLSGRPGLVEPNKDKLGQCLCRTLDVLVQRFASPKEINSILGVWESFALMSRSFFSIYDKVFQFVRAEPATKQVAVPAATLNELFMTLLLSPLLASSLTRQPLPMLVATDAAPEYGFGICVAHCSDGEAADVCHLAERRGDYVRLTADSDSPAEVPRLGKQHRLVQTQKDFTTVISSRAKWKAHSGVLEANAYLLALKWVGRQARKHHAKIPFLVDAKVVVGAASKGRSSARALRTCLRNAACCLHAGG